MHEYISQLNKAMKEQADEENKFAVGQQRQGQRRTLGLSDAPAFPHRKR